MEDVGQRGIWCQTSDKLLCFIHDKVFQALHLLSLPVHALTPIDDKEEIEWEASSPHTIEHEKGRVRFLNGKSQAYQYGYKGSSCDHRLIWELRLLLGGNQSISVSLKLWCSMFGA